MASGGGRRPKSPAVISVSLWSTRSWAPVSGVLNIGDTLLARIDRLWYQALLSRASASRCATPTGMSSISRTPSSQAATKSLAGRVRVAATLPAPSGRRGQRFRRRIREKDRVRQGRRAVLAREHAFAGRPISVSWSAPGATSRWTENRANAASLCVKRAKWSISARHGCSHIALCQEDDRCRWLQR